MRPQEISRNTQSRLSQRQSPAREKIKRQNREWKFQRQSQVESRLRSPSKRRAQNSRKRSPRQQKRKLIWKRARLPLRNRQRLNLRLQVQCPFQQPKRWQLAPLFPSIPTRRGAPILPVAVFAFCWLIPRAAKLP